MTVPRLAAAAALLVAVAAPLAPASAANCVGSDSTAKVCVYPENAQVDPTGGSGVHQCVIVGDPEHCVPVDVPTPSYSTSGPLVTYTCTVCGSTGPLVQEVQDRVQPVLDAPGEFVDRLTRLQCAPQPAQTDARPALPDWVQTARDNIDAFVDSCV